MPLPSRFLPVVLACALGTLWAADVPKAAQQPGARPGSGDWTVFRGNAEQRGIAEGKLSDSLQVLWTFKTGDAIEGAPAIAGGIVYAGSMDEHLYAVDLATGKEKWKFPSAKADKAGPFKASPSFKDGRVYAGDLDGNLFCLDATKGTKIWAFESGAEVGGVNFHGTDVLFGSHDEHLYCVDKTGKERWKFKIDGPIYGSVAVAEGKTFLAGCDSQMHVIDVVSGKAQRSVDLEGQTGATCAVLSDRLYVGTMKNEVRAVDWKKGLPLWTYKGKRGGQAFFSSPAVTENLVVIGSRDKSVHCINRKDGEGVWTFPTGGKVDSSPVVVDNRVVVGSLDGEAKPADNKTDKKDAEKVVYYVYVLDLKTGKAQQKLEVDGPVSGSPAVVNGLLLIGTQKGTLYCFGDKKIAPKK